MPQLSEIINYLKYLSTILPLEVFTFVGSVIEEVIGPIPSPVIMVTAGSLAKLNDRSFLFLVYIALTGALGKLIITLLWYYIGDKGEDIVVGKFGKFLGISHQKLESFGKNFQGNKKDMLLLFLLRAIPVFPTGIISFVCGILRVEFKMFTVVSFLGFTTRNLIFLTIGYSGLSASRALMHQLGNTETFLKIAIAVSIIIIFAYFLYKKYLEPKIVN